VKSIHRYLSSCFSLGYTTSEELFLPPSQQTFHRSLQPSPKKPISNDDLSSSTPSSNKSHLNLSSMAARLAAACHRSLRSPAPSFQGREWERAVNSRRRTTAPNVNRAQCSGGGLQPHTNSVSAKVLSPKTNPKISKASVDVQ